MTHKNTPLTVLLNVWSGDDPVLLRRCLVSIRQQTVLPDEILVVSDGQLPIPLRSIIEDELSTLFDLVRIISTQSHLGLWNARNVGLRSARNSWIVLQDADDVMHPQRLEVLSSFTAQEQFHVISSSMLEFDVLTGACVGMRSHNEAQDLSFRVNNPINHPTVMLNRDAVLKCGGYRDRYLMEDYDLWIRMSHQGCRFKYIQIPLVAFSVSKNLFSRRGGIRFLQSEFNLFKDKIHLKHNNQIQGFAVFVIRVIYRILPSKFRRHLHFKVLSQSQFEYLTLDRYLNTAIADLT